MCRISTSHPFCINFYYNINVFEWQTPTTITGMKKKGKKKKNKNTQTANQPPHNSPKIQNQKISHQFICTTSVTDFKWLQTYYCSFQGIHNTLLMYPSYWKTSKTFIYCYVSMILLPMSLLWCSINIVELER